MLAVSRSLAYAAPGPALQAFAQRLCELSFGESEVNTIWRDELFLAIHRASGAEFRKWHVGINLHAAPGDGRWWQDHRVPGGVGLSLNSVGHMARQLVEELLHARPDLAEVAAKMSAEKLVDWALPLAMDTILGFSNGNRPGTRLVPITEQDSSATHGTTGEADLPKRLAQYDRDRYKGWYHTDETVPAEFFEPVVERPAHVAEKDLQFSYLHRPEHPEFTGMAMGEVALRTAVLESLTAERLDFGAGT